MPRRYNRRRRRNSSNFSYLKYAGSANAAVVAARALKVALFVKSLVNSELKTHDGTIASAASSTATLNHLSSIAVGDDFNSRDGRKVRMKSIQIKGSLQMHTTATNTRFRMVLFQDTMNTGTAPTASDIIANTYDLRDEDPNNMARYKILWDKRIILTETVAGTNPERNFQYYKKLDLPVTYTGTAGSDYGKNTLWLLFISDEATNTPTLNMQARMRYRDN